MELGSIDEDAGDGIPENAISYSAQGEPKNDDELKTDPKTYYMFHEAHTESPCLSFDIIRDDLGNERTSYPHTLYVVAGTQAPRKRNNKIMIMKWQNLRRTLKKEPKLFDDNNDGSSNDSSSSSSSSSSSDDDDDDDGHVSSKVPAMYFSSIDHYGCINRIRTCAFNASVLVAVWSETKSVSIYDLKKHLVTVDKPSSLVKKSKHKKQNKVKQWEQPLFASEFPNEGFAIDWCSVVPGVLATGDCSGSISVWSPRESVWDVNMQSLMGHTSSTEDIQWSSNERDILASCSVDKSIRIWDVRNASENACVLAAEEAHASDINTIHWNRVMKQFIVSGGDDGCVKVWDLRNFKSNSPIALFKHHLSPVTSVEWHPTDDSVFASSDETQVALWDLSVEVDASDDESEKEIDVPPQLLFTHLGQKNIKELHWHPQIPGVLITTSLDNFNIFKTINI